MDVFSTVEIRDLDKLNLANLPLRLEPTSSNYRAALKNVAHIKSGQK